MSLGARPRKPNVERTCDVGVRASSTVTLSLSITSHGRIDERSSARAGAHVSGSNCCLVLAATSTRLCQAHEIYCENDDNLNGDPSMHCLKLIKDCLTVYT